MRKLILSALISASLFAQDTKQIVINASRNYGYMLADIEHDPPEPHVYLLKAPHHSHKRLWISIAAIAGAAVATGLIESRQGSAKPPVPAVSDCRHLGHLITCVGR